jgi:SecD/SecF fusion protein
VTDRRRNIFILLLVGALLVASFVVITANKTRLGLDLKGGVELVYQAKPTKQAPKITPDSLDRAIDIMRDRVNRLGVAEAEITRLGNNQVQVGLPDVTNAAQAQQQVGTTAQLFFFDWEPNVLGPGCKPAPADANVTGGPSAGSPGAGSLSHYDAVIRASQCPAKDYPNSSANGNQYFLVNDKTKTVIDGPAETQGDLKKPKPNQQPARVVTVKPGQVVIQAEQPEKGPAVDQWFVLKDNPALKGTDIKNPEQNFDNGAGGSGAPIVTFDFTGHGRKVWQNVTRQIAQRGQAAQLPGTPVRAAAQHFAVTLDNTLISVPFIDFKQNPDGIDGVNGSQIEGGFTISSAQRLANLLKSGALPVKLDLISQSQVSATLGKQALDQGLKAGIAGFIVVALFLLVFYRVLGLIAVGALVIYSIYFYALIKLIPITLTLPGIAGLILTIGVAADANIVIFERVKEEIRAGRSVPAAIATGYRKGLAAIIDANVVTFMVAFILFILAVGGVRGFAFVLGIGTLTSLFTAVLATSAILGTLSRSRAIDHRRAVGAGERRSIWGNFDFMGASKWFFSFSGCILLIGALAIGGKGLNFGIDFESGTRITTTLQKPANERAVADALQKSGVVDNPEVQKVTGKGTKPNTFQVSTSTLKPADVTKVDAELSKTFGIVGSPNTQSVGPSFGQTVARSAIVAIIASLLVISVYIALRFEWKYAVPVLIALMHDLLITAGVYSLTGREVTASTVAALLTILGYSLYDTIIVFDRIRENVPRMPRAAFSQIVNRSMNEVLTRSLATSFCTALPILSLLLFGGDTLKDFAFALLVGTISGAYSSVFIASPVLTHWKEREPVYEARAERIYNELGTVPAYATAIGGAPVDVAPKEPKRRRGRLTSPDEPDQISQSEFQELVRDIQEPEPEPAPTPGSGRDLDPDEVVMPKQRGTDGNKPKPKRPRNKRHGRTR